MAPYTGSIGSMGTCMAATQMAALAAVLPGGRVMCMVTVGMHQPPCAACRTPRPLRARTCSGAASSGPR